MNILNVEEVFKDYGVPNYTFVKPREYNRILVNLRSQGKSMVIEGPSGIGKTCCLKKCLDVLKGDLNVIELNGRIPEDVSQIEEIIKTENLKGIYIIDDFHRINDDLKSAMSNFMKIIADEERPNIKLVLVGINKAGQSLIDFADDLTHRIDVIQFGPSDEEKLRSLIIQGEEKLNIKINDKNKIISEANGSFHIVQVLCKEICMIEDVLETQIQGVELNPQFAVVKEIVYTEFERKFGDVAREFAMGPRLRQEGRAPYLHILKWLFESEEWTIDLKQISNSELDSSVKSSVNTVIEQEYLNNFLTGEKQSRFEKCFHFDNVTNILAVEDPKFVYFLRNIKWTVFSKNVGYKKDFFTSKYDFALSFAGEDRLIAEQIYKELVEEELSIFYDFNEQHIILGENLEEYLRPIYESDAEYVIVLLSEHYSTRLWTKFESDQFKTRFGEGRVIPILFSSANISHFDPIYGIGNLMIKSDKDLNGQIKDIVEVLRKKTTA